MGILKTRKNKRFNYEPRYYKSDREGSPYQMERKFDQFRRSTADTKGLKAKFSLAWEDFRYNTDKKTGRIILIIISILVLIFLFIIDFDLTIFNQPF